MIKFKSKFKSIAIGSLAVLGLAACGASNTASQGASSEQQTSANILSQALKAQPIPQFDYSQLRANLIDIETMQAKGTVTTSFFFNQGVQDPILSCPSVGLPIPTTAQLTNPDQIIQAEHGDAGISQAVVSQIEANGIYTGDSSGTYVICIDGNGNAYPFYWEGFVSAVGAPAKWDTTTHSVVLTGAPPVKFSSGQ